jgi:hypothetical protein
VKASAVASWLVGIVLFALVVFLIIYSYTDWQGARYFGIADKKLWDYLELLIVPAVLAFVVYWLNRRQDIRQQQEEAGQQRRQEDINERQQRRTLEVVTQQAQDTALRAYLDQMSQLLTDKERPLHRAQQGDSLSSVARARTLTVLLSLDANRKRSVLQFLYEVGLIDKEPPIVDLTGAELRGIDLSGAVQLSGADLSDVYLSGADLSGADLTGANLSGADLDRAKGITNEKLEQQAYSLDGATMPNGQKYEDWLRSKGSKKKGDPGGSL